MKGDKQNKAVGSTPEAEDGHAVSVVATAAGDAAGNVASSATVGSTDTVGELQAKVDKLEDGLLRSRAELQNAQRRAATERLDAVRYANAELMKSLVHVVDDFERALSAADQSGDMKSLLEGMRLVYQNFSKALADHGLETVDALNQPFDPSLHEALMQQPTAEKPAGTVIEQAAKGYRLRGRVIRPARVIVAKAPDAGPSPKLEMHNGD